MLHSGQNLVDGVLVEVVRKRIRRINIRVESDGVVHLSVPKWWATLREGEAFLRLKWPWVTKARAEVLARPVTDAPATEDELARLAETLSALQDEWTARLREPGVTWGLRRMKSQWGSCHFGKRHVTYAHSLARVPRELVEYVVVHELTHLVAHNHGPAFYRHMDERLPDWQARRHRLNKRDFGVPDSSPPSPPPASFKWVQGEFEWS